MPQTVNVNFKYPIQVDLIDVKTRRHVSVAKKMKKDMQHTSALFTGNLKLPNSAFCISKTTKPISTKFIFFLPYICTTLHIKVKGNRFSIFQNLFLKIVKFPSHFSSLHKITNIRTF